MTDRDNTSTIQSVPLPNMVLYLRTQPLLRDKEYADSIVRAEAPT